MSLAFLSDHCVPAQISRDHARRGHFVTLLRDVLPVRFEDPLVIAKAQERKAILLSLNGDFADIVTYPPGRYGGIVAIQLNNHPEIIPSLLDTLGVFLDANPDQEFYAGKLFLVEVHRIRVRK